LPIPAEFADRLAKPIPFVPHADFASPGLEHQTFEIESSAPTPGPKSARVQSGAAFLGELVAVPLLTHEDEKRLFLKMNFLKSRAEEAREKLVERGWNIALWDQLEADLREAAEVRNRIVSANVRLVVSNATKLSNSVDQLSELTSEGFTPLIRAVELFDVGRGFRFSTYATWAIRNQMHRFLAKQKRHAETLDESASLLQARDPRDDTAESDSGNSGVATSIERLLTVLSEREREIIAERFGLHGRPAGQSLAEISRRWNLSKERVRQISLKALELMRQSATVLDLSVDLA
jgi:RNA polymerase sigma factor (sigma-70 family)